MRSMRLFANTRLAQLPRRRPRACLPSALALAVLIAAIASPGALAAGGQWYKTELHRHSVLSADGRPDLGILADNMQSLGYNAVFVTDHDRGSSFTISGANANKHTLTDTIGPWSTRNRGSLTASSNAFVSSPVHSGTASRHLAATAAAGKNAETMLWADRGPNFRSGNIMLDFWVNPARIDAGSGVDVSVSIGGDPSIKLPFGYTTSAGVVTPGKSTVLVWQLGAARSDSTDPNMRVITHALPFTLNTWNHYTIDVSSGATSWNDAPVDGAGNGLQDIPAADQPVSHAALSYIKIAAQGNGGTADAYFDDYALTASAPVCPANEFTFRNSLLASYGSPGAFALFPAREMGQTKHTQQFNFGISDPTQYQDLTDASICPNNPSSAPYHFFSFGSNGIPDVRASGYPTQSNHPGITDTTAEVVSTRAHGADGIEAFNATDFTGVWDQILGQNVQITGTAGADVHELQASGTISSFIQAPSLTLDDLMHSYFEGRLYLAPGNFPGRIVLNLDGSPDPYAGRYPVYVPDSQTSATVHLAITDGLASTDTVKWVTNSGAGATTTTVTPGTASYQETHAVALNGAFTYVRAEVRTSAGSLKGVTQPIFFESVGGLPADKSVHIDETTTTSGRDYTNQTTKGISSPAWSSATETLSFDLINPTGTRTSLVASSATVPLNVTIDGQSVTPALTLADYQAATGSSWFYDSTASQLLVKDVQQVGTSHVAIKFGLGGQDTQAPTVPTGLTASAVSSSEIKLSWSPSTDDVGVTGYGVYRDGALVGTVDGATTTFTDTGLTAATSYSYTVDAVDAAGNRSARSTAASAMTFALPGASVTFNPVADSYVVASTPTTNFGTKTALRVDADPSTVSYLRFNVSGVSGTVASATLRVFATSSQNTGYDVFGVFDNTWSETAINFNNAPALAGTKTGSSGPATLGSYNTIDVTPLVSGNGLVSFALKTASSTALGLASRESTSPPQLVIKTA